MLRIDTASSSVTPGGRSYTAERVESRRATLLRPGEVPERLNGHDWKSCDGRKLVRGFESLSLRLRMDDDRGQEEQARRSAAAGTAVFFLVAPGVVAGLIPWWITGWNASDPYAF